MEDPLAIVPDLQPDTPNDTTMFLYMVPRVRSLDELMKFQMVEHWIKELDVTRKQQNQRLLDLKKAWDKRKFELREELLALVASGSKSTMVGTTYQIKRPDWDMRLPEDDAEQVALYKAVVARGLITRESVEEPAHIVVREQLTKHGREKLKEALAQLAETTGEVLPGTEAIPPGVSVGTRLKAATASTPFMTAMQDVAVSAIERSKVARAIAEHRPADPEAPTLPQVTL